MTSLLPEIWTSLKAVSADAVANGLATLVGAFLGAMLAFLFQLYTQRRQEHRSSLMATHRILFCLLQQANTIALIRRDFVSRFANSPVRFLEIPAVQEFDTTKNLLDANTFSFMLESSQSRGILYNMYIAQESYIEALRIFNERSRMHRSEVQPLLARAGLRGGGQSVTPAQIEQALGPLVLPSIINTTDLAIEALERALPKLMESKCAFRAYATKRFRGVTFTDFDFPDEPNMSLNRTSTGGLHPPADAG